MKAEILRLLKETDGYISGQQLCDRFQVSRTAVWKVIDQLKKDGYQIEAVRNKGYHLVDSPDIMSKEEIESMMKTQWMGKQVVYFDQTDSTNTQAKAAGEQDGTDGMLFVADMQNAGKGRRGREWNSPTGTSISMTILLKPDLSPNQAPMITLVMALSLAEALEEKTGIDAGIKWPNDIVCNGHKLCGMLTEMAAEITSINYVVVGVGINVNQEAFPEEIAEIATSLKIETGNEFRRAELVAAVTEKFEKNYAIFLETQDLSGLQEAYNERLVNRGREVRVLEPKGEYEARAIGIDQEGELLVSLPNGEEKKVFAGEVSVRGIYGYV